MAVRITGAGVALTVGIIVVTGLIIGGLFWARQSSEQARNEETTKIAQEQLEQQSDEDVALNEGENKDENKDESTQNGSSNSSNNGSETQNSGTTGGSGQSGSELPQTGAGDVVPILGAALLALSSVAYYKSRRALFESL